MAYPPILFEGQTRKGLDIRLRHPVVEDVHVLREYINTLSQERTFLYVQGETIGLDQERDWLNNHLSLNTQKLSFMVLAFHGDQLAGNADINLSTGPKRHSGIFGISVAKEFRGQGVGELIMQTVIEEAVRDVPQLELITLEVFGNNPIAQALYRKMGFIEYGRLPGGILHRDVPVDCVLMYRPVERI
jgi:RimJ/RimL family protein N-acetyltransferase